MIISSVTVISIGTWRTWSSQIPDTPWPALYQWHHIMLSFLIVSLSSTTVSSSLFFQLLSLFITAVSHFLITINTTFFLQLQNFSSHRQCHRASCILLHLESEQELSRCILCFCVGLFSFYVLFFFSFALTICQSSNIWNGVYLLRMVMVPSLVCSTVYSLVLLKW